MAGKEATAGSTGTQGTAFHAPDSGLLSPSGGSGMPAALSLDRHIALFLDFDGTLVEIASRPDAVRLEADLLPLLRELAHQLGGALAIVSGRALPELDQFMSPLSLPIAAEHGAVQRFASGEVHHLAAPDLGLVLATAQALAALHPLLRVEAKSAAIALHYRQAPELEALCLDTMRAAADAVPGLSLIHGKRVVEVKPAGVSKGSAIAAFMLQAPFSGRTPVFAGDDTTDEAGFEAVQAAGGMAIKVGEGASAARHRCDSPAALRSWLRDSMSRGRAAA
jgi:trehalose 6-phosphate phosphatase